MLKVKVKKSKSKSTLMSIFQFVCTDREIEIVSHDPENKNNVYRKKYVCNMYVYTQSKDTCLHVHTSIYWEYFGFRTLT